MLIDKVFTAVFLIAAVQGLFVVAGLLYVKTTHPIANRLLALFILLFSLELLISHSLGVPAEYLFKYPHMMGVSGVWMAAYAPLLYLYTKALAIEHFKWERKLIVHFLPVVVNFLLLLPMFMLNTEDKLFVIRVFLENYPIEQQPDLLPSIWLFSSILWFVSVQIFVYYVLVIRLLRHHEEAIRQRFSSLAKVNLHWLYYLMHSMFVIMILYMVVFITWSMSEDSYLYTDAGRWLLFMPRVVFTLFIYAVGYMGLLQPSLFGGAPKAAYEPIVEAVEEEIALKEEEQKAKYQTSSLTDSVAEFYKQQLLTLMEEKQPYRDSELTSPQLADIMSVSVYHLSQVINGLLGQNFFDFVNSYRIREAKKRLEDPKQARVPILDIAMDVGFNAKSAFYNAFKKQVGMTPTEYRTQHSQVTKRQSL